MDLVALEGIAVSRYEGAGCDPCTPNLLKVVRFYLGADCIRRGPRPIVGGPAALVRIGIKWEIITAHGITGEEAFFAVAHEFSHWCLREERYRGGDEERCADYLAAALIAPRPAFLGALRRVGEDFGELAAEFNATETNMALRTGEVLREPIAVITPQLVRVRGPEEFVWPEERVVRSWARRPPPGLAKTKLKDDPRRIVLRADELTGST